MYTSIIVDVHNLTFASLRTAELGFFGLHVKIFSQDPFCCGFFFNAGVLFTKIFFFAFFLEKLTGVSSAY